MTRIIAGSARGLSLDVPGSGTRPTSDRVRESLLGALDSVDAIAGARVLDLFAGSGALGLECASRGAASVDLVEKAGQAAKVATTNAAKVAKSGAPLARVHAVAAATFLKSAHSPWDLVFLDPPYDIADADLNAVLVLLADRLSEEAIVIVERAKRSPGPDWAGAGLDAMREKTYGDTTVWWGQPA
ncbi:16S rRNA (guanine(966)-N(2))-methyltransferase RsmD [Microbacterium sp. NC79]|uniref:16S rRNA (guanine(966)-N(2))-methyltransferase RsmD n=1 Tax=Microbacterium sp. NC79 TaxID=2851009 RepID=UPI001C2B9777|nr:16S rRNA (guanine(966)-N(2))-methyltransferase RsmD [Microbacterium sp. NC79]MBV0894645.1 16S rRNA (guanine(966)-N(2))-methyltransferase RsmD [Microbacterium sp. NC79]